MQGALEPACITLSLFLLCKTNRQHKLFQGGSRKFSWGGGGGGSTPTTILDVFCPNPILKGTPFTKFRKEYKQLHPQLSPMVYSDEN